MMISRLEEKLKDVFKAMHSGHKEELARRLTAMTKEPA